MRLFRALVALFFLAAGIAVGALNPQPVLLDLGLFHIRSPLGLVVLVTLLSGAVLGGLAITLSAVLPLQQRLRATQRRQPGTPVAPT